MTFAFRNVVATPLCTRRNNLHVMMTFYCLSYCVDQGHSNVDIAFTSDIFWLQCIAGTEVSRVHILLTRSDKLSTRQDCDTTPAVYRDRSGLQVTALFTVAAQQGARICLFTLKSRRGRNFPHRVTCSALFHNIVCLPFLPHASLCNA